MTLDPRVRLALDLGAATSSVALIGPLDERRRLLGSVVTPSGVDEEVLVALVGERVRAADPALADRLGLDGTTVGTAPRLVARSAPPPLLAVLATTALERAALERVADVAGWRTNGASLDQDGPIGLTRVALEAGVAAVAAAGEPATSREETAALVELAAVVAGIATRPAGPPVILVGELARDDLTRLAVTDDGPVYAPGLETGSPAGSDLTRLLDRLDPTRPTPRRAALAAVLDLAVVLDRRIELVDIGHGGGLRAVVGPAGLEASAAVVPSAGLAPAELDDDGVDAVLAWSTVALDRHRMRDRLRELRDNPWVEAHGDGARLRLAAVRAAATRLVRVTPWLDALPGPDLVLVAGGAWAAAPGPAIALAIADVIRRPGASQLAYDHARLLGPLGSEPDPVERRALVGELADDLLAPLGSVIVPQGFRAGRSAGRLTVRGSAGETELELVPGGLQLVDLPPGEVATAELRFRDPVGLGARGRRLSVEVGGGLGGLLVDLRDVPLRLPDRSERRRAMLAAWQDAFWAAHDG